jgi:hypothetical protein
LLPLWREPTRWRAMAAPVEVLASQLARRKRQQAAAL